MEDRYVWNMIWRKIEGMQNTILYEVKLWQRLLCKEYFNKSKGLEFHILLLENIWIIF